MIRILSDRVYLHLLIFIYTSGKFLLKNYRLYLSSAYYFARPTPRNDIPVVGNGWKPFSALSFQAVGNLRWIIG